MPAIFGVLPAILAICRPHGWIYPLLWLLAALAWRTLHKNPGYSWRMDWNKQALNRDTIKAILKRFVLFAALLLAFTWVMIPERLFSLPREKPQVWVMVMILYPLLSVIPQELIFRSFFFRRYESWLDTPHKRMVASALAFGWAHIVLLNWVAVLFSAAAPGISALILFALVRNNIWFEECLSSEKRTDLIAPILTLLVALSAIVLAFLTTPPVTFDRVEIVQKEGRVEGGYVARSEDGIFVATCKQFPGDPRASKRPRLQVIPNDSVEHLTVGGDRFAVDNGKRPSLFDLGLHLFSQDKIEEHLGGWRPSVRGRLDVCEDSQEP